MERRFSNRAEAGRVLAVALATYAGRDDVLVLALPRGGVPVGFEISRHLNAPMDLMLVRKLGVPGREELAMGAIASGGFRVMNPAILAGLGIPEHDLNRVIAFEQQELDRRERLYRKGRPALKLEGRKVILVDDGIATGATMRVAAQAARAQNPAGLAIATPVIPAATQRDFQEAGIEVTAGMVPIELSSIGEWYEDFSQLTDAEVTSLLAGQPGNV